MELSDLMDKFIAGHISCGSAIEYINALDNPVKEIEAYTILAEHAFEVGDNISARCINSMIKIANARKDVEYE